MNRDAKERAPGAHATPDGLPPLREVIADLGLTAKKSLGQNFILDLNLTRRIARIAGDLSGTRWSSGAGPEDSRTAAGRRRRVVAVERDERCLPALSRSRSATRPPGGAPGDALRKACSAPAPRPAGSDRCQPALRHRHDC